MKKLQLTVLADTVAICRFSAEAPIPDWAVAGPFVSITRTSDELSIVCSEKALPELQVDIKTERGWKIFKVMGPLDFSLTGVLASIAVPLAEAGVSIFAISTYDTDYVLVREKDFEKGHEVLSTHFEVR